MKNFLLFVSIVFVSKNDLTERHYPIIKGNGTLCRYKINQPFP